MTTILVIEDDPGILENIVEILEFEDFKVLSAENGQEGLKLAESGQPDLIVSDIMMPEMDGFGVLSKIRKNPQTQTIPFIFLTARADRDTQRKGMSVGADDYLSKPFTHMELLEAVNTRLSRKDQLMTEVSRQTEELGLLRQLDEELTYRMNPDWVITIMVDWVLRRTSAHVSIIAMVENDAGVPKLRLQQVYGEWAEVVPKEGDIWELSEHLKKVYYQKETLLVDDLSEEKDYLPLSDESVSMMCLPIATDTIVWGVLLLESKKSTAFSLEDVTFLRQLANRAAVALEHSALFEKLIEQQRQEIQMRQLFGRFVSPQVAAAIQSGDVNLSGESRDVSALFCDIRGFTGFSEYHSPQEVVTLLNNYLPLVVDAAQVHGGTVNKFGGDSTLVIFGAPVSLEEHAYHAILTALHIRNNLKQYNLAEKENGYEIRIGIGINTGEVIAGAVGPEVRQEYTVIGDTVNLASRIEALNKTYPQYDIFISDYTYGALGDKRSAFAFKNLGEIPIRGKSIPVGIWTVLGFAGEA